MSDGRPRQSAQTTGDNSPALNMSGLGDVIVTYGEDAETAERRHHETRQSIQALPEAITAQVMTALRESGIIPRAEAEGLAERTVLTLAQRLRPEEAHDLDRAVREVEHAVEIALATIRRSERPTSNEDAFVDGVLAEVAQCTREDALDRAAQAVDDALIELDARENEQRDALRRARAALLEAGISQDLLRRDVATVARRVEALVALETPDIRAAWTPLFRIRQDAFFKEGYDKGLNLSLEVAVALARRMLETATTPDERGNAGHLLGTALWALGAREAGTARLEEAVAAYRLALDEWTRERVPLKWATTQNNLGNALRALGAREAGTARLEEAVAAYRLALDEWTRERVPLKWAATQMNLGNALATLGERESNTARLEAAVAAYRTALEERTRERAPLDWARTQNNLGAALATLGERESNTARLEQAVVAYRLTLEEWTRARVPLDWAATQNNLGAALKELGERESDTARLEQAVVAFRLALEERTRARVPLDWARTQNNLGTALATLGKRESDTARLEQAVVAYRLALEEWTRERVPFDWATTQMNLGNALRALGEREAGTVRLEEAAVAFDACLTIVVSAWPAEWVRDVRRCRENSQAEIARRRLR